MEIGKWKLRNLTLGESRGFKVGDVWNVPDLGVGSLNRQGLMGRNDSHELADILEVYYLCMLLGFAGRYSLGGKGDLYAIQQQTGDKIQRIRQTPPQLSPEWVLPNDNIVKSSSDPWVKWLLIASIGFVVLTAILFGVYKFLLNSGVTTMANLAKGVI